MYHNCCLFNNVWYTCLHKTDYIFWPEMLWVVGANVIVMNNISYLGRSTVIVALLVSSYHLKDFWFIINYMELYSSKYIHLMKAFIKLLNLNISGISLIVVVYWKHFTISINVRVLLNHLNVDMEKVKQSILFSYIYFVKHIILLYITLKLGRLNTMP